MNRYWDKLKEFEADGFEIIVDKSWEDIHPRDLFDDSCHDIDEICRKIDNGTYDWFILRVRALIDGHELGSALCGGFLYEDVNDVFKDGIVADMVDEAVEEAKREAVVLKQRLEALA